MEQFRHKGRFVTKKKFHAIEQFNNRRKEPNFTNPSKRHETCNFEGTRIIDIKFLSEQLWCADCEIDIPLRTVNNEFIKGLGSIFTVKCILCDKEKSIHTSKSTSLGGNNYPYYNINVKTVKGCIDNSCGRAQVNHLLTAMDLPVLSQGLFERCRKAIISHPNSENEKPCVEDNHEEKQLILENQKGCASSSELSQL